MNPLGTIVEGGFLDREWQEFEKVVFLTKDEDIFYDGTFSTKTGKTYREISRRLLDTCRYLWANDRISFDDSARITCHLVSFLDLPEEVRVTPDELGHIKEKADSIISDKHEFPERQAYSTWILKALEEIQKYSRTNIENYKRNFLKLNE